MALLSVKYDSRLTRNDLVRLTKHAELCRYFAPDVVYVVIPREVWIEHNVSPCPPDRTDITKDSQSMEKISLFLLPTVSLVGPPSFALVTITSTRFDTYLLTHLLTDTYLLVL